MTVSLNCVSGLLAISVCVQTFYNLVNLTEETKMIGYQKKKFFLFLVIGCASREGGKINPLSECMQREILQVVFVMVQGLMRSGFFDGHDSLTAKLCPGYSV